MQPRLIDLPASPATLERPALSVLFTSVKVPWSASRYGLVIGFALVHLAVAGMTRAALAIKALTAAQVPAHVLPAAFAIGAGYDLVTGLYLCFPFAVYLLLLPERLYHARWHRAIVWPGMFLATFGICYLAAVEFFFFDEFNARFNYVAVEYLIYPHEVFVNIWQSYPVARALIAAAAVAAVIMWRLRPRIAKALQATGTFRARLTPAVLLLVLAAVSYPAIDSSSGRVLHNRVADELAANGIYSFFSAAANAHLDYMQFYATVDATEAAARVRRLVGQRNASFIAGARNPLARHVLYAGAPKLLNVIVLLEESLGAEFVGAYGAQPSLTPNLDRIAVESLVFTNTLATGTRTVRGMEAVTASFPPVPAEAIVKRPGNEGMFNWSDVMIRNGYSPTFIYGGYGAFDNMNYFFGHNGYRVIDRSLMDEPRFSNIWGVSDEDLFRNALRVYDGQHARGERIFSVIMTTSNHKPFTFPSGVPGVKPAGGGREAGVRYADYAIGYFIESLRQRPYFDDTMVVIVADHGARAYGREDIPLPTYAIPFLVYSPGHVEARRVDQLLSQIDVAPTVLGLLNFSYDSVFFGKDVLADPDAPRVAPLNHNRDIALYRDGVLHELGFRSARATLAYNPATQRQVPAALDIEGARDAASLFQLAYALYASRGYRLQ
jgi:phosphoglycerol transferase MdoB-like AlkP superfamily enzyme